MNRLPPSVQAFFPDAKPVWPKSSNERKLTNINQLSIVVHNVDAAIEYFGAAFGWGPFHIGEASRKMPYKGGVSEINLRLAFTMVGDLEVELLQPISGSSPHMDHLQARGEGLLHIRIATHDIEAALQHLATLDIKPTLAYSHGDRLLNVYVDSDRHFGVRIELILNDAELERLQIGNTYAKKLDA